MPPRPPLVLVSECVVDVWLIFLSRAAAMVPASLSASMLRSAVCVHGFCPMSNIPYPMRFLPMRHTGPARLKRRTRAACSFVLGGLESLGSGSGHLRRVLERGVFHGVRESSRVRIQAEAGSIPHELLVLLRGGDILIRSRPIRPYVGVDPFGGFGQERFRQLGDLGQRIFLQIQDALGDIRLQGKEAKLGFVLRLLELQRALGDFAFQRCLFQLDLGLCRFKRSGRFFPEGVVLVGKILGTLLDFGEAAVVFSNPDIGDVRGRVRVNCPSFAFSHRAVVPIRASSSRTLPVRMSMTSLVWIRRPAMLPPCFRG